MHTLNEIDIELTKIFESFNDIVDRLKFKEIGIFNIKSIENNSDFLKNIDYQGIYLIEIKNNIAFLHLKNG